VYCEHSAKQAHIHEITPESDYVFLYSDGSCTWEPRYEMSVSQCNIDVTWFPYDRQNCSLIFVSWTLTSDNIRIDPNPDYEKQDKYVESDNWHYLGEYVHKFKDQFHWNSCEWYAWLNGQNAMHYAAFLNIFITKRIINRLDIANSSFHLVNNFWTTVHPSSWRMQDIVRFWSL